MAKYEEARELEPGSLVHKRNRSLSLYYFTRQYDRAIRLWREEQRSDPGRIWATANIGLAYLQKGSTQEGAPGV